MTSVSTEGERATVTAVGPATRRRLDRRRILAAALAAVDREGLDALSMRRLGSELGVDPMAIYHHVDGKERLYDGIAELLWEEVARPQPDDDPVRALRVLAHSLRDLFRRHPAAAPLILRWTSLSRPELELYRAYLDTLTTGGVAEPAAVLRPLISYALGTGYTESTWLGVGCPPGESHELSERELLLALGQALPPGTSPELASAAASLIADCDPDRCFEDGLELMLAGLSLKTKAAAARRRRGS
ncbi:MAG: TetR/AcrR family transcriptional regulator [Haloechinothrix sp.]